MMRDVFVGHHVDQPSIRCPASALTWVKHSPTENLTTQEARSQLTVARAGSSKSHAPVVATPSKQTSTL
jgi:hypothetical protein